MHRSSAGSFARLDCNTAFLSSLAECFFQQPPKYKGINWTTLRSRELGFSQVFTAQGCGVLTFYLCCQWLYLHIFFSYQFQVLRSKDFPPAFLEAAFLLIQFAAKQATFPAGADEGRCIDVTLGITALSWGMTSNYSERCSI